MDYLTRRFVAQQYGVRGVLLRGRSQYPRIAALGVRVNRDDTVARNEICQACIDVGITVQLADTAIVSADAIEHMFAAYGPEHLKQRIESFLDQLARATDSPH